MKKSSFLGLLLIVSSEWMGSFLFFESVIESVIVARDKFLKNNGVMIPSACSLYIAPANVMPMIENDLSFWKDVEGTFLTVSALLFHLIFEGIDMSYFGSVIKEQQLQRPIHTKIVAKENILEKEIPIKRYDLRTMSVDDLEYVSKSVHWECTNDDDDGKSEFSGFVSWFEVFFPPDDNVLTTSPFCEPTHWNQEVLVLDESFEVEKGDTISCDVSIERNKYWRRHYCIFVKNGKIKDSKGEQKASFEKQYPHHRFPTERKAPQKTK